MKILSIGKELHHDGLDITSIEASSLPENDDLELYTYIIVNGGDGTIEEHLNNSMTWIMYLPLFSTLPVLSMSLPRSTVHPR